jgi:hypothetical protein
LVASAPPRSWSIHVWDAAKVLLVYCAAGPLVGLFIFAVGSGAGMLVAGPPGGFWIGPFLLLYGLLFAHFTGVAWAALAAMAAIGLRHAVSGLPAWIGPFSGAVSFAVALIGGFLPITASRGVSAGTGPDGFVLYFVPLMALVHIGAASASWLLVRNRLHDCGAATSQPAPVERSG